MSDTFGDRLQRALQSAGRTRAELAKVLRSSTGGMGVSTSAVGQVINGPTGSLTAENTVRAARFLRVSAYWLATGEGRQSEDGPTLPLTANAAPPPSYISDEQALIRFGALLGRTPKHLRASVAALLSDWALSGGADDRRLGVQALLDSTGKQRSAA